MGDMGGGAGECSGNVKWRGVGACGGWDIGEMGEGAKIEVIMDGLVLVGFP